MEESTAAGGGLGGGERLAPTVDRSAAMPGAMVENAGSSAVNAGDAGAAPETGAARPVQPKEPTAFLETLEGMVGRIVRPLSP